MSINLKDTTYLLNNNLIKLTKAGKPWRCGKGYRKDWTKLIGKEVLLHSKPYTLTNRVKKNNKWYLVFTDGQNNYTELQSKALHNKNLAKARPDGAQYTKVWRTKEGSFLKKNLPEDNDRYLTGLGNYIDYIVDIEVLEHIA